MQKGSDQPNSLPNWMFDNQRQQLNSSTFENLRDSPASSQHVVTDAERKLVHLNYDLTNKVNFAKLNTSGSSILKNELAAYLAAKQKNNSSTASLRLATVLRITFNLEDITGLTIQKIDDLIDPKMTYQQYFHAVRKVIHERNSPQYIKQEALKKVNAAASLLSLNPSGK